MRTSFLTLAAMLATLLATAHATSARTSTPDVPALRESREDTVRTVSNKEILDCLERVRILNQSLPQNLNLVPVGTHVLVACGGPSDLGVEFVLPQGQTLWGIAKAELEGTPPARQKQPVRQTPIRELPRARTIPA